MAGPEKNNGPEYESVTGHILDEYFPSKQKIESLRDRAAKRNLQPPEVPVTDLPSNPRYRTLSHRDNLEILRASKNSVTAKGALPRNGERLEPSDRKTAAGVLPTKDANGSSGILSGARPQDVLEAAVRRQGYDPNKPSDVRKLQDRHTKARADFTTAERSGERKGVTGSKSLSSGARPQDVLEAAVRRQGYDPDKPGDVGKLQDKHTKARSAYTTAERSYDERTRGGRSV